MNSALEKHTLLGGHCVTITCSKALRTNDNPLSSFKVVLHTDASAWVAKGGSKKDKLFQRVSVPTRVLPGATGPLQIFAGNSRF